jgi:transposase
MGLLRTMRPGCEGSGGSQRAGACSSAPQNLTNRQAVKLKELLSCRLKTIRAYFLKEKFQFFWEYVSPAWAAKFMNRWCEKVIRLRVEPMKKIARMIRSYKLRILNWFQARGKISLGAVERPNNKIKASLRKFYGFLQCHRNHALSYVWATT